MKLNPSEIISNRYEIIEKLGTGGMAVVYKAKDTMLDRFVTFKVLKEEHLADSEISSNFGTEAKAAARLNHQNIVRVFDTGFEVHSDKYGKEQNIHYIVMEYIDGNTIKELIKERSSERRFTENEALGVSLQIAKALAHAHENNVVHRDIKPQNILITEDGDVKVTDFGIALRRTHSDTTVASESMGSVHYSSPEQSRGRFVDGRSDIYSLGIVMFEMITGKLPFNGDTPVTIALKHVNEPLPNILELAPEVSEKFIYIIKKCTAKLANQRYNNIYELIDDLKRLLEAKSRIAENEDYNDYEEYDEYEDKDVYDEDNPTIKLGRNLESRPQKRIAPVVSNNQKSRSNQNLKIIALASSVVLVFIAIVIIIFLIDFGDSVEPKIMPNVIGMTREQIEEVFGDYYLYIEILEVSNPDVPTGTAFTQSVSQGTVLEEGDEITIQINYGSSLIIVPNFIGYSNARVLEIQQDYIDSLNFQVLQISHETVPVGVIFNQDPPAGTEVSIGEVIFYYMSTGPQLGSDVVVPNFINMSENELHQAVSLAGLVIGDIISESHDTPSGIVFHQSVPSNSIVFEGHEIDFRISTGPAIVEPEEPEEVEEPEEPEEIEEPYIPEEPYDDEPPLVFLVPVSIPVQIELPILEEYRETVYISVIFSSHEGGGNVPVLSGEFHISEFPLSATVTGNGLGEILVFADGIVVSSQTINLE